MADPIIETMTRAQETDPWVYGPIEITESGNTKTYTFQTQNKFLDGNIAIYAHANAAGSLTLNLTNLTTAIDMGTATSGYYNPTVSLTGSLNVASAGWITSGNKTVTDSSVGIGKVAQSTLKNGTTTISSGSTITPGENAQTINISAGYNAARTIIVGAISTGASATIKSGTASLGTLTYTYNSDTSKFDISGTATIGQATATTEGYISNSIGTREGNSNTVTQTVDIVTVGSEATGTFTKAKPVIVRTAKGSGSWVDAGTGNATDSPTANKPYVQVDAAAVNATLTTRGKVTAAGYGTTSNFSRATNTTHNVGSQAADTVYIPIKEATIKSPDTIATFTGPTYQSSGTNSGKFTIIAGGTIDIPTISSEGYISSVVGTKSTGDISGTKVLNKIKVGTTVTGTTTLTHNLTKGSVGTNETWTSGASSGNAVTTAPSSGVYVKVNAAALSTTITSTGKVVTAGYGTTTSDQYTADTAANTVVSAATADIYVPVQLADGYSLSVANSTGISGTSDVSIGSTKDSNNKYTVTANNLKVIGTFSASTNGWFSSDSATDTDVDSSVVGKIPAATFNKSGATVTCATGGYIPAGALPQNGTISNGVMSAVATDPGSSYTNKTDIIIPSGGWLKLTAGYYPNTRISLATLVPNEATIVVVSGKSKWIHPSYTAYDNNGALIAGDMDIYDGTVEIT